jgi:DNA-binding transcriptional ArsR family regulator
VSHRVLTDPRAIRALAHPARLTVLDALADGVELTATECAEAAGISPSAMSYHLRALEKWGFVERAAPSGDGRERPWRGVPGGWSVEGMSDEATRAATGAATSAMLQRVQEELLAWTAAEPGEPPAWRDRAHLSSRTVWLTADEAAELEQLYQGFLQARRGRTAADHPDGARPVRTMRAMIPID